MDLRKLSIFVRVAGSGSFSRAAEELHMAQPAVSIAVRKLEESLGVTLLDRSARRPALTAEGRALLERARPILAAVEDLERSASAMAELLRGTLDIACPSMLATYYLPDLVGDFLAQHPGLTASVTQAGTARVEQMLLADEIELGVTTYSPGNPLETLEVLPLVSRQMVCCVGRDHPLADAGSLELAALDGLPMVIYESGYFIRNRLDQLCREAGISPDYRMQSNFLPLLTRMVKRGLGATVGLDIMAEQEAGIVGLPFEPAVEVSLGLAKRRGRTISRANQAFLDWMKARDN
jgi:DNA-binding transcriptional LysR family regulator